MTALAELLLVPGERNIFGHARQRRLEILQRLFNGQTAACHNTPRTRRQKEWAHGLDGYLRGVFGAT